MQAQSHCSRFIVLAPNGGILATTLDGALANVHSASLQDILGYLKMWVAKKS